MVQGVADLFHQGFKSNKVNDHARSIQITIEADGDLVVVSVQQFPRAVREGQEVGGCKAEIVLGDLDAEIARHERRYPTDSVRKNFGLAYNDRINIVSDKLLAHAVQLQSFGAPRNVLIAGNPRLALG